MTKKNNPEKKSILKNFSRLDYIFLIFLFISLLFHISKRTTHYQELDSDWAYLSMQQFPDMAYSYISWSSYKNLPPMGIEKAKKIANNRAEVRILRKGGPLAQLPDSSFLSKLAEMPFAKYKRLKYINEAVGKRSSYPIQSMYALPYTTTYSPGMGLLYGLVTKARQRYEDFNSSALLITLLLFHISGWLLFLILKSLNSNTFVAALTSVLYLASISLYSYAYHLGSTVWNFATAVIWLYLVIRYYDHKRYPLILGFGGALIILFNYLFVFYYIATLIVVFFSKFHIKSIFKNLNNAGVFIAYQIPTLLSLLWVVNQFLQLGQGVRGTISSINQFPDYFYYIILNFFGIFRGSLIDKFQFIIFTILLVLGLFMSFRYIFLGRSEIFQIRKSKKASLGILGVSTAKFFSFIALIGEGLILLTGFPLLFRPVDKVLTKKAILIHIVFFTLSFYFIAVSLEALGFAPARHILFLAPVLFIFIYMGIVPFTKFLNKLKLTETKLIAVAILCLVGIYVRSLETNDVLSDFIPQQPIDEVVLIDKMTFRDYYNLRPNTAISQGFPSQNFSPDRVYLYLSQTIPFDSTFKRWDQSYQGQVDFEKLQEDNRETGVYFTNHNPYPKEYNFSRPNNLYATVFKLKPKM